MKLHSIALSLAISAAIFGCGSEEGGFFANQAYLLNDNYEAFSGATLRVAPGVGIGANDALNGFTLQAGSFTTTQGGTLNLASDGSFTYTPASGFTGLDSLDYQVGTSSAQVRFNVNRRAFFVDNTASAGGNGSQARPFNRLSDALTAADRDNDLIFLFRGDGSSNGLGAGGTIRLGRTGLWLVGEGAGLTTAQGSIVPSGGFPVLSEPVLAAANSISISGIESRAAVDGPISALDVVNFSLTKSRILNSTRLAVQISNVTGSLQLNANLLEAPDGQRTTGIDLRFTSGSSQVQCLGNSFLSRSSIGGDGLRIFNRTSANVSVQADNNLVSAATPGSLWTSGISALSRDDSQLVFTASNNTISDTNPGGLSFVFGNNSRSQVTLTSCEVFRSAFRSIQFSTSDSASATMIARNCNFRGGRGTASFSQGGPGLLSLGLRGCKFLDAADQPAGLFVETGGSGNMNAALTNNTGQVFSFAQNVANLGGAFKVEGLSQMTTLNTISGITTSGTVIDVPPGSLNISE
ncbi:hypothetical protein JST97_19940 [bacterium]|nr:hypothetical protein [bacterium]